MLLVALALGATLHSSLAKATQWGSLTVMSVQINGVISPSGYRVTVFAERGQPSDQHKTARPPLGLLRVSSDKYSVTVPKVILAEAPGPHLEDIEVGYCCWGVFPKFLGDGPDFKTEMVEVEGGPDSVISVDVPYGDAYEPEDTECEDQELNYPRLSIEILDGQVVGYKKWLYRGTDWIVDEYEWKDGRAVQTR